MGTEVVVGLALSALAAGAQAYNQHQVAKKQDNELAAQLRSQADKQHAADQKTAELINAQAKSTDTDEKASAFSKFTQQMQANKAQAVNPLNVIGAVSDAYKKSGSDAALGIANSGSALANLTASIDAPRQQRANDARLVDRYDTDINQIRRFSMGDDFLSNMRLRGIKPNPWISAVGTIAGGAGGSMMSGGSGGGDYSGWDMNSSPASTSSGQWAYNLGRG